MALIAKAATNSTLRADDHYTCKWSMLARSHVYVIKHHRPIAVLGTLLSFSTTNLLLAHALTCSKFLVLGEH